MNVSTVKDFISHTLQGVKVSQGSKGKEEAYKRISSYETLLYTYMTGRLGLLESQRHLGIACHQKKN